VSAPGGVSFIADAMLGRLAKWLRVMGYDTDYSSRADAREIIRKAAVSGRIILTRDRKLPQRRGLGDRVWVVQGDDFRDQLRQTVLRFHLDPFSGLLTRCLICNERLLPAVRPGSQAGIPEYVLATQEHFTTCPKCRRIYWPATHKTAMVEQIRWILGSSGPPGQVLPGPG